MKRFAALLATAAQILPAPALAQDQEAPHGPSVIESAQLVRFLSDMNDMCDMASEIVFAQGVLILAQDYGWDLWSDEFVGSGQLFYLFNLLEESELPVIRLMNATRRNTMITAEDLSRAERLYADYTEMRGIGARIFEHVSDGEVAAAAAIYHAHTIPMRRQLRVDCFTVADAPRRRIAAWALEARLGR
jgi:hypothetical protein